MTNIFGKKTLSEVDLKKFVNDCIEEAGSPAGGGGVAIDTFGTLVNNGDSTLTFTPSADAANPAPVTFCEGTKIGPAASPGIDDSDDANAYAVNDIIATTPDGLVYCLEKNDTDTFGDNLLVGAGSPLIGQVDLHGNAIEEGDVVSADANEDLIIQSAGDSTPPPIYSDGSAVSLDTNGAPIIPRSLCYTVAGKVPSVLLPPPAPVLADFPAGSQVKGDVAEVHYDFSVVTYGVGASGAWVAKSADKPCQDADCITSDFNWPGGTEEAAVSDIADVEAIILALDPTYVRPVVAPGCKIPFVFKNAKFDYRMLPDCETLELCCRQLQILPLANVSGVTIDPSSGDITEVNHEFKQGDSATDVECFYIRNTDGTRHTSNQSAAGFTTYDPAVTTSVYANCPAIDGAVKVHEIWTWVPDPVAPVATPAGPITKDANNRPTATVGGTWVLASIDEAIRCEVVVIQCVTENEEGEEVKQPVTCSGGILTDADGSSTFPKSIIDPLTGAESLLVSDSDFVAWASSFKGGADIIDGTPCKLVLSQPVSSAPCPPEILLGQPRPQVSITVDSTDADAVRVSFDGIAADATEPKPGDCYTICAVVLNAVGNEIATSEVCNTYAINTIPASGDFASLGVDNASWAYDTANTLQVNYSKNDPQSQMFGGVEASDPSLAHEIRWKVAYEDKGVSGVTTSQVQADTPCYSVYLYDNNTNQGTGNSHPGLDIPSPAFPSIGGICNIQGITWNDGVGELLAQTGAATAGSLSNFQVGEDVLGGLPDNLQGAVEIYQVDTTGGSETISPPALIAAGTQPVGAYAVINAVLTSIGCPQERNFVNVNNTAYPRDVLLANGETNFIAAIGVGAPKPKSKPKPTLIKFRSVSDPTQQFDICVTSPPYLDR